MSPSNCARRGETAIANLRLTGAHGVPVRNSEGLYDGTLLRGLRDHAEERRSGDIPGNGEALLWAGSAEHHGNVAAIERELLCGCYAKQAHEERNSAGLHEQVRSALACKSKEARCSTSLPAPVNLSRDVLLHA
jgi:hypothetical protein